MVLNSVQVAPQLACFIPPTSRPSTLPLPNIVSTFKMVILSGTLRGQQWGVTINLAWTNEGKATSKNNHEGCSYLGLLQQYIFAASQHL